MKSTSKRTFSDWSDKDLLPLLSKGDEAAFEEIYNRYWERLFAIAASKLNNLTEAEEIVQDVFFDVWKRRETLNITASLSAYLAVAIKYKVFDFLGRKTSRDKYALYILNSNNRADSSTENLLFGRELKEQIDLEVSGLPEKCQLVYQLSRTYGLSQKQIALELDIAEKTVEAHLSKALRTLRTSLTHLFTIFWLLHSFLSSF